ncbi:hypothetical protein [Jeotgalicoccus sp. ATCC 8456]|uniref:hypothetical protein n=1 Tax=Jeotgalicoccus sp. ATCC 8456 TaxID=946435 RepID=UPI0018E63EFF|nr:hypothetical protein [Jeotgalicoccus sp. ATCC 8456]QQD85656.1 hypothetical protein JEM45_03260 [Jeotgalicoccus sp. ATCC 8456]
MNQIKTDMMKKLQQEEPNCFNMEDHVVANFVENGAKNLHKRYRVKDRLIEFYHGENTYGSINGLLPGTTSNIAYNICKDKYKTEEFLTSMNLPTLKSKFFTVDQINEAQWLRPQDFTTSAIFLTTK